MPHMPRAYLDCFFFCEEKIEIENTTKTQTLKHLLVSI